jgi:hypothetical protein
MKNNIKVGEYSFEFKIPEFEKPNTSIYDMMNDWKNLIESQNIDKWVIIPELPQYKFKNLKIDMVLNESENNVEQNITFLYDDFEFILK